MKIAFWILTVLLAFAVGASGFADVTQAAPVTESIKALGYPLYMMTIIGVFKIAGAACLFVPQLRRFAYAGIAFMFIGAFASHVLAGLINTAVPSLVLLALLAALVAIHRARFPYLYDFSNRERMPDSPRELPHANA